MKKSSLAVLKNRLLSEILDYGIPRENAEVINMNEFVVAIVSDATGEDRKSVV